MGFLPTLDQDGFIVKHTKPVRIKKIRNKHKRRNKFRPQSEKPLPPSQYHSYIGSNKWAKRRRRYYATNSNVCKICGSNEKVTLHHLTYERLGIEDDKDLMPLCWMHHEAFHDFIGGSKKNMEQETKLFIQGVHFDDEANAALRSL